MTAGPFVQLKRSGAASGILTRDCGRLVVAPFVILRRKRNIFRGVFGLKLFLALEVIKAGGFFSIWITQLKGR